MRWDAVGITVGITEFPRFETKSTIKVRSCIDVASRWSRKPRDSFVSCPEGQPTKWQEPLQRSSLLGQEGRLVDEIAYDKRYSHKLFLKRRL